MLLDTFLPDRRSRRVHLRMLTVLGVVAVVLGGPFLLQALGLADLRDYRLVDNPVPLHDRQRVEAVAFSEKPHGSVSAPGAMIRHYAVIRIGGQRYRFHLYDLDAWTGRPTQAGFAWTAHEDFPLRAGDTVGLRVLDEPGSYPPGTTILEYPRDRTDGDPDFLAEHRAQRNGEVWFHLPIIPEAVAHWEKGQVWGQRVE